MLNRTYQFVIFVMPENQFITVGNKYFLHFLLIQSGWGNLMGKFNGIIRSVRLHIMAVYETDIESDEHIIIKLVALHVLLLKKKPTISFLYEGDSISSENTHAFSTDLSENILIS